MSKLSIAFTDNPNPGGIYYPTQFVRGLVILNASTSIKDVRGLRITVQGEAKCKWTVPRNKSSTTYRGKELYLNLIIYLLGSNHGECMEIPAGVHNYSFSCQLPNNIPFSIEGKYGYVRFKIDANLDIAWGFDYKATKDIHVARYEDLNYFPELRASTKIQTLKSFWSWTGKSNKVFLNVCLPKTGFALGEIIPVNVEIKNESSVDIEHTTIALNQVGRYNSTCPHVKTEELKAVIVKERGRGVKSCQTTQFQVLLEIPQVLVISNNRYCKVFQISYEVELVGITTGLHQSPKVFTKITVGSVRLTSNDELIGLNATAPIDSNEDTASLYDHPPSYEEAIRNF